MNFFHAEILAHFPGRMIATRRDMKWFFPIVVLIASSFLIGCGSEAPKPPSIVVNVPPAAALSVAAADGGVTPTPSPEPSVSPAPSASPTPTPTPVSIRFSGNDVYSSGASIQGITAGFSPGVTGSIVINSTSVPSGQTTTLTGTSAYGSTITVIESPGDQMCPYGAVNLCANISGVITLSSQEIQANASIAHDGFPVLGLSINLQTSGTTVSGGYAQVCLYYDNSGHCHGIQVNFLAH